METRQHHPGNKPAFSLDHRLENDSVYITRLGLCELRVQDEKRWPWLVLVPLRPAIEEIHELTPLDQAMLSFETNMVSKALKTLTSCTKINVGALGNKVRQLHVHIIARMEGDAAWPGPVWGYGEREPHPRENLQDFIEQVRDAL